MAIDRTSTITDTLTGSMMAYGGSSAPVGWQLCDGTAISRTTYAALFAVIGTTFGAGDGSTTFAVPNLQDKLALGSSGTLALGTTNKGATTSQNTTTASTPTSDHAHTLNSHVHSYSKNGANSSPATSGPNANETGTQSANHTHTLAHTHTTPDLVLNYIIKT